jgi:hypothetical protein
MCLLMGRLQIWWVHAIVKIRFKQGKAIFQLSRTNVDVCDLAKTIMVPLIVGQPKQ